MNMSPSMTAKELGRVITLWAREQRYTAIWDSRDQTVLLSGKGLLLVVRCRPAGRLSKLDREELEAWLARHQQIGLQARVIKPSDWPALERMLERQQEGVSA
jgi:hypothetical protein